MYKHLSEHVDMWVGETSGRQKPSAETKRIKGDCQESEGEENE